MNLARVSRVLDKMAASEENRRKALKTAVAALSLEKGFDAVDKASLSVLAEIIQSSISEVGRLSRTFAELAGRTVPTLPDVEVALADSGLSIEGLEEYSKRPERRHIPKQVTTPASTTPNVFQTSTKAARPSNIPDYLPPLPNPHTFQRTPSFPKPGSDYQSLREKISVQMKDSRQSLSRLLSKTRPSIVVIGSEDPSGNYSCIIPDPPKDPTFFLAIAPTPEDLQEIEKEERSDDNNELDDSVEETPPTLSQPVLEDCLYLKPPKKLKSKELL